MTTIEIDELLWIDPKETFDFSQSRSAVKCSPPKAVFPSTFKFLSAYPSTVKFLSVLRREARLSEHVRVVIRFVVVLMRQHVEQLQGMAGPR